MRYLIVDLETDSLEVETANIKWVLIYDPQKDVFKMIDFENTEKSYFRELFAHYDKIITFNGNRFDVKILKNNGVLIDEDFFMGYFNKGIDIYEIFKKRAMLIFPRGFDSLSLRAISKKLFPESEEQKGDIDYNIFKKKNSELTKEELEMIRVYGELDVKITWKLWCYLLQKFEPFKEFIDEKDAARFKHITSSTASYGYKAICKMANMEEKWNHGGGKQERYTGAFVLKPLKEEAYNCLYLDFASLYPMIYVHNNLFSFNCSCCKKEEKWHGDDRWKVNGYYCKKQQGKIEEVIKKFYLMRKEYKKVKDGRELAIKLILNCFSEDTQVMTIDGIKLLKDCKKGDIVYSINLITEQIELKPIEEIHEEEYDGDMIHFKCKNKDLIVTPEHDMLNKRVLKNGSFTNIERIQAKNVMNKNSMFPILKPIHGLKDEFIDMKQFVKKNDLFFIKQDNPYKERNVDRGLIYKQNTRLYQSKVINSSIKGKWFFQRRVRDMLIPEFIKTKDLFYFIGIVISEGNIRVQTPKKYENGNIRGITYNIYISQDKKINPLIYNKIKKCLDDIGIRYSINDERFEISSKFWYDFFSEFFKNSFECNLPDWVWKYDSSLLYYLHEGLYDGDGDKKSYRYSTVSEKLKNDMIRLNFLLGYRTTISKEMMKSNNIVYRIFRTGSGWYRKGIADYIKNPTNKIICCSVKDNHTIYAGRNDKLIWTGQSLYGASSMSNFAQLYSEFTASDCTLIGQQIILYSMDKMKQNGFIPIYGDTDSVIIEIPQNKTKEECLELAKELSKEISQSFPFPWEEFNLKLEDELKYIQFFKKKDTDDVKKKNYIYINKDDKMTIKGLDIIQKDTSQVSKTIFENYLKQHILEKKNCKFSRHFIEEKIIEEVNKDFSILAKRFSIKDKYNSNTTIYFDIMEKYGTGEVLLVKNFKIGAGKNIKYCSLQEAKGLSFRDLDLSDVFSELSPFIREEQQKLF